MSDYDVTIERKNETKLYFNLADGLGRPSRVKGSFKMAQFPRQALKMQQGDTQHSDREPPYASIEQRDFSGGRGWDRLERDKTRFYDSYRVQTWMEGIVLLGPEETYMDDIRSTEIRYWWQDNEDTNEQKTWQNLWVDGDYNYYSYKFTPSADISPQYVYLALGAVDYTDDWYIQVHIYDDNGGSPNNSQFDTGSEYPDAYEMVQRFEFESPSQLNNGTTYWLVIYCNKDTDPSDEYYDDRAFNLLCADDAVAGTCKKSANGGTWAPWTSTPFFRLVEDDDDFELFPFEHLGALYMAISYYDDRAFNILCADEYVAGDCKKSADGGTWAPWTSTPFFRLVEDDDDFELFPFEHLGALYMAISYYDGSDPKVYMNGARGTVTSATATSLDLSGAGWTVDEWIGCIVVLYSGTGADADRPWRLITDNDADTLTVSTWDITPDETTKFVIIHSDKYTEVTGHNMTGRITDVCTYGNIVYFARGDFNDIYHMYDDTFALEAGNRGSFIQVAPSSATGEMQIYLARASFPPRVFSADPTFCDDGVTISDLDFSDDVDVGDANMEADDGSWVDYNGPISNAQSLLQKYDGRYSRRIVTDAADKGVSQTLSGLTVGSIYHAEGWIYNSGANSTKLEFDGTELDSVSTTGSWIYVHGYKATTSATPTLRFLSKGGACTYYIDAVKVSEVETPLPVGHDRITGMVIAGEPRRLYVLTNAGVIRENYGYFRDVSPGEFMTAKDNRNGAAQAKTGADVYLSFLDNVCKYYDEKITIIGPNINDEGLPASRRGTIADMIMYGEWLLVAIDGGSSATSSILVYNKLGWHEYYRAPAAGLRITRLYIQPMPENYVDRLWFNEGADIAWLPVDLDPPTNDNYRYSPIGWLQMSTIYGSLPEIEKFFHKIRIAGEDMGTKYTISTAPRDEDGYEIEDVSLLSGETYETIWGEFSESPVDELSIDEFWAMEDFTLRRLQIHLSFYGTAPTISPKLRAIVVDYMEHLPVAWSYVMRLVTMDRRRSLTGEVQEDDAEDDIATLQTYVNSAEPVRIYTPFGIVDETQVKLTSISDIEPIGYSRRGEKEKYTFVLTAVDA